MHYRLSSGNKDVWLLLQVVLLLQLDSRDVISNIKLCLYDSTSGFLREHHLPSVCYLVSPPYKKVHVLSHRYCTRWHDPPLLDCTSVLQFPLCSMASVCVAACHGALHVHIVSSKGFSLGSHSLRPVTHRWVQKFTSTCGCRRRLPVGWVETFCVYGGRKAMR